MGLFAPAWKNKDKNKAMKAVENEFDMAKLARAAAESPHHEVRDKALRKCDDQELYKKAVFSNPHWSVRETAAYHITDQAVLMMVAGQDSSAEVRKSALIRITDETYKIVYVQKISDRDLALTAAEGVKSEKGRAMMIVSSGKSYIAEKYLKELGKIKKLNGETVDILRKSNDPKVKEFLIPYSDQKDIIKMLHSETGRGSRGKLVGMIDDKEELYKIAIGDKDQHLREKASDRLKELHNAGKIKNDWWNPRMDNDAKDQRQAMLLKKSGEDAAARELAEMITGGQADSRYVWPRINMAVIEQIEKMLTEGSEAAEKTLYRMYKSKIDMINPELHPYAREQAEARAYQKHKDAMVDSSVCGETFRHDDGMYGEFITPI